MTYTQAVRMALSGDTAGFDYLYNATKNNKYYLAVKYVKNEETAKDVLQEAYIRAWKNLDKLKEPEKFDSWLSQIVVNAAKNELEKKNHTPLDLRAESGDEEDDTEIFDRAVSSWENVPELEYTKEETRQLVHELIDSLSDEQRLVVIAFELEGLTTREIAEQLGCSEATVKSRLRYGRNNIREKAEELQKKGYKLYGVAPVVLLILLLKKDTAVYAAEPAVQLALAECETEIGKSVRTVAQSTVGESAAGTAKAAGKIAFFSTTAGKAAVGIVAAVVVAGGVTVAVKNSHTEPTDGVSIEDTIGQTPVADPETADVITEAESETVEQEDTVVSHDEAGWSDTYGEIIQHVSDNTLYELGELGDYGFDDEIYENLTESGEQFEYALLDLDGDDIPELVIRANTSHTTYDGMSYWIMFTYQMSAVDDQYTCMPVQARSKSESMEEGVASVGGSRVWITMNEDMDEFFIGSLSAGTGECYTYRGYMMYDEGLYWWCKDKLGYYTYEQEDARSEEAKRYPVEIPWKTMDTPLAWE